MNSNQSNPGGDRKKAPDKLPTAYGPVRILVVDDDFLMVDSTSKAVTELGHTVAGVAPSGEAALEIAQQSLPDLALLDINLGSKNEMNGVELARRLMTELGVPSILISAHSNHEHVQSIQQHGEASGVFGYLIKPVSKDELRVMIGVVLPRIAIEAHKDGRISQLQLQLNQRRTVEAAKWILVKKRGWDEPLAHDKMQKAARDRRKPLVEIAEGVIAQGDLDV